MELNPRTGQQFLHGGGEPAVQQFLAGRLRPGMVFYDLGANSGFFSLIACRSVGGAGRVYSFEPSHENAERARANMSRNGFTNCTVVEAAVWNRTGTVTFDQSDPSSSPDRGTGHVEVNANSSLAISVPAIALDDFCRTSPAPDIIKCDVEGAEVEAFRGARCLLESHRPVIICEIHSAENDRVLRTELESLGYAVRNLDENHICAEFLRE